MSSPTREKPLEAEIEEDLDDIEIPEGDFDSDGPGPAAGVAGPAIPAWKKATAVAAWITAVFFLYVLIGNLRTEPAPTGTALSPIEPGTVDEEIPADSLGVRFAEVRELWNSLDRPPSITKPLRRFPENGQFDSFFHLFETSAVVAGAIDAQNDYIVALMVRSNLGDPDVGTMYLHLCQMLHPFSPTCIDNYFEIGLDGQTLADFAREGREVSWTFEGNEWRVTIADNLQTIRVQAPGSN
ncbi:MAG: hypothetical protein OEM32_00275 [Acidimicrobiia bacterium]|nr:hypothetical protein [Acidimicrobiia bacterium]